MGVRRFTPLAGLVWAVASIALAAALYAGTRAVPGFTPFLLHAVQVGGVRATDQAALLKVAAIVPGSSLFAVDVDRVRAAVATLPWVRAVRVVRQLPGTLRIEIEEHEPAFLARLDELRYVTAAGRVVLAPLDQGLDFPVITGADRAALEGPGPTREALLEWVERRSQERLASDVAELHFDPAAGLTVYTTDGAGLHLGWSEYDDKLQRLVRLRDHLADRRTRAVAVNLRYDDRIIARLAPAGAEGPRP